jgi:hypothetical protein
VNHSSLTSAFLRWSLFHTALGRGWWLVTAVYLVVVAELSPPQLILIGVFQGITVVIAEIPAGVIADAVSRRLAVVLSHLVMGTGMAMTAFVTDFPLLVISNCLWGLGWALVSGADVAWITDELERPDLIDGILASKARYGLLGTVAGIIAFGALASTVSLRISMAAAGISMVALGVAFVTRWPEERFEPAAAGRRWSHGTAILRRGIAMARADRMIFLVLAGTLLVNGGAEGFGRLFERRLIDLGMPTDPDPIVWFAALALLAAALGAVSLRFVETRVHGTDVARQTYVLACAVGTVGLVVFAHAPSTPAAVAGALLVSGIALPLTRTASVILVNRRATNDVRATLHSMLSEAENLGEIAFGLVLAVIAGSFSAAATLTGSAVLIACAGIVVGRTRQR